MCEHPQAYFVIQKRIIDFLRLKVPRPAGRGLLAEKPERAVSAQKVCFPARDEVKYGYRSAVENGARRRALCFSGIAEKQKGPFSVSPALPEKVLVCTTWKRGRKLVKERKGMRKRFVCGLLALALFVSPCRQPWPRHQMWCILAMQAAMAIPALRPASV